MATPTKTIRYIALVCLSVVVLSTVSNANQVNDLKDLPVSSKLIKDLKESLKNLKHQLRNFNVPSALNKNELHRRVENTKEILLLINQQIIYNNVVIGDNNTVKGVQNIIIGDDNDVEGSSNFIFVSNYQGSINGDLIFQDWRIELDKSHLIPVNPKFAISRLDDSKNIGLQSKIVHQSRKVYKIK